MTWWIGQQPSKLCAGVRVAPGVSKTPCQFHRNWQGVLLFQRHVRQVIFANLALCDRVCYNGLTASCDEWEVK